MFKTIRRCKLKLLFAFMLLSLALAKFLGTFAGGTPDGQKAAAPKDAGDQQAPFNSSTRSGRNDAAYAGSLSPTTSTARSAQAISQEISLPGWRKLPESLKKSLYQHPTHGLRLVIFSGLSTPERNEVVYILSQINSIEAIRALGEIAASPNIPAVDRKGANAEDSALQTEQALRSSALEGIEASRLPNDQVESVLANVLRRQRNPTLRFFTSLSLQGIRQGRRGKLTRFINQSLNQFANGEG